MIWSITLKPIWNTDPNLRGSQVAGFFSGHRAALLPFLQSFFRRPGLVVEMSVLPEEKHNQGVLFVLLETMASVLIRLAPLQRLP